LVAAGAGIGSTRGVYRGDRLPDTSSGFFSLSLGETYTTVNEKSYIVKIVLDGYFIISDIFAFGVAVEPFLTKSQTGIFMGMHFNFGTFGNL
jgi:hypothetical protein